MIRIDSLAAFRIQSTVRSGQIRSFDSSKYKVLEIQHDKVKKGFKKILCSVRKMLLHTILVENIGECTGYLGGLIFGILYSVSGQILEISAKYRISEKVTYKTRRRNLLYNIVQKITVKRQNSKPPQKIVYHCKMSKYSVLI